MKNGVKLSWSLSCTLGFPDVGRTLFIFPLGINPSSFTIDAVNDASISRSMSTDLHLKLISESVSRIERNGGTSLVSVPKNSSFLQSSEVSSPKTPSCYQSIISSPSSTQNNVSSLEKSSNWRKITIREGFKDEKFNELLRTYAVRWLHGRYLLKGNILSIPILGQLCIFQVEDSAMDISLVDSRTKIHVSPMPSVKETSNKEDIIGKEQGFQILDQTSRLGGLNKEYAILKEIINFSFSHKSALMRYEF